MRWSGCKHAGSFSRLLAGSLVRWFAAWAHARTLETSQVQLPAGRLLSSSRLGQPIMQVSLIRSCQVARYRGTTSGLRTSGPAFNTFLATHSSKPPRNRSVSDNNPLSPSFSFSPFPSAHCSRSSQIPLSTFLYLSHRLFPRPGNPPFLVKVASPRFNRSPDLFTPRVSDIISSRNRI